MKTDAPVARWFQVHSLDQVHPAMVQHLDQLSSPLHQM
jgi:hypothetical protein